MTIASLAQTIRHLPPRECARLFDRLQPALEDYLLLKIAHDRFRKASHKRVAWEDLKS